MWFKLPSCLCPPFPPFVLGDFAFRVFISLLFSSVEEEEAKEKRWTKALVVEVEGWS